MSALFDTTRAPVVVVAPPGAGKTVAVSDRVAELDAERTVMVRLELRHNAPADLVADLRVAAAGRGAAATLDAVLGFGNSEPVSEDLRQFTVALDRADLLQSPDSLDVIRRLVHPKIGLIVTARDARAPACRVLRFEAYAAQVGPEELAFTRSEAAALLDLCDVDSESSELADIFARSEGWAVSISLLARHARSAGLLDEDVAGTARDEFRDFLTDQVVSSWEDAALALAAQIAIEDGAVDASSLTRAGFDQVEPLIEDFANAGLLVARTARTSRRLHPALVDALLWKMRVDVDFGRAMWSVAVDHYLASGERAAALRLAMRCEIDGLLQSVLERTWPACFIDSDIVVEALEQLPLPVRHRSASLLVLEGVTGALRSRDRARMEIATRMAADLGTPSDPDTRVLLGYAELVVSLLVGRYATAVEQANTLITALATQSSLNPDVRGTALRALGYYFLTSGDLSAAKTHFDSARALARITGLPAVAAASSAGLAMTAAFAGHVDEVADHLGDVRAVAATGAHLPTSSRLASAIAEAMAAVQRGYVPDAMNALDAVDDVRVAENQLPFLAYAQALTLRWRGGGMLGVSAVEATISRCEDDSMSEFQRIAMAAARSASLLGAGRWDDGERIARANPPSGNHPVCTSVLAGLACLGRGAEAAAQEAVAGCLTLDDHVPHSRVFALFVSAVALSQTDKPEALTRFYQAVALAARVGCVGELVLAMPQLPGVARLITGARTDTTDPTVLSVCTRLEWASRYVRTATALPALTPREREIALRLGSDETLVDLANSLFVSPNTLNSQVRQLYRKLGASNRAEAVGLLRLHGMGPIRRTDR